ncbi:MAG: transporter ATP-binding protein [Acidimicrobiales bacterium]|nr:transporter ATP-binding protein [Acidimicrobiales bacterium]
MIRAGVAHNVSMPGADVVVRGLHHQFATRSGPLTVLDGVDLEIPAGGYASLVGPSGAGKSTLLSLLGGLEPAQRGTVEVGGALLAGLDRDGLAAFRRTTVGFVFQHFGLLDALTAAENIDLAGALTGVSRTARRSRTRELLDAVGLLDRADHRPAELSGGERQRVAIARALANRPRLVLADEPTGNLDDESTMLVVELLETLPERLGCSLVIVTHDRALAARAPMRLRLADHRLGTDDRPGPRQPPASPALATTGGPS